MKKLLDIRNKLKAIPQGAKASAALVFANLITMGISYITTPLYTRLLSTDEYGQVSVFLTWLSLLGIIAMFNLYSSVFNNGMVDYPDKRDEYSFSMLILSNVITVSFFALLLGLYPILRPWIGLDWPLMILMGVIFLFQPARYFWSARQRYELKYKMNVLWSVITTVFSPLIAIICILLLSEHKLYARIFGAELPLVAICIGFYIYLAVKSKWKVQTKYWKEAFLFNLPLLPHYLSTYVLGSSDRLMISRLVNDTATAYYSVAYSVSAVAQIAWSAINASLVPYTYEKCKKKEYSAISAVTIPIMAVNAVGCLLVIMLAPEVIAMVSTADYKEAIYAIPPIVGGFFFQMHYALYGNVIYYYKKPKYVMYASVISAGLNLILNYIFINLFGYIAAGYTTLFCYLLQSAINYWGMKKVVGNAKVYNMRYLGIMSFGIIAVALLSNFIYDYMIIRYAIVLLLLLLCIIFHKKIIVIIKKMRSGE